MQYKQDSNRFYLLLDNGQEIAEMTFTRVGAHQATIDHTFVDPSYRKQGIADNLLDLVVETLEQENREIIPICSFAVTKLAQRS
ncbi:GNAT family N-acetyltransferase [Orbaceae bacterium ESL0727]|nr:GNAT family N-acetyltransferase [Orbaceae bacterium ESL0727]